MLMVRPKGSLTAKPKGLDLRKLMDWEISKLMVKLKRKPTARPTDSR